MTYGKHMKNQVSVGTIRDLATIPVISTLQNKVDIISDYFYCTSNKDKAEWCVLTCMFFYSKNSWGLGLLLWEILSVGEMPFGNVSEAEHRQMVLDGWKPYRPQLAHQNL